MSRLFEGPKVEEERSDVYEVRTIDAEGKDKPGHRIVFGDLNSAQKMVHRDRNNKGCRIVHVVTVATVTEIQRYAEESE